MLMYWRSGKTALSELSSQQSFSQNSKEWVDTTIKIAGSTHGGTFESAYQIANHLICSYKDSILAALEIQRIHVCKPMSATEFSAMVKAGNINVMGEKELKKHLRAHLGRGFCPTSRSVNMLSEGHGEIYYGKTEYTFDGKQQADEIEWTEKRIDDEISRYLQRHLQSKAVKPSDVKHVQVVASGDHGDTAFQFGASVSAELHNGKILDFEVLVCNLICRKDTGPLIEATILSRHTAGLMVVAATSLHIYKDSHSCLCCEFKQVTPQESSTTVDIKIYITVTWHSKQWHWGRSRWQGTGACSARQEEQNS